MHSFPSNMLRLDEYIQVTQIQNTHDSYNITYNSVLSV